MGQRGVVGLLWVIAACAIVLVVALVVVPAIRGWQDGRPTEREEAQSDAQTFCEKQVGLDAGYQYDDCVTRYMSARGYSD